MLGIFFVGERIPLWEELNLSACLFGVTRLLAFATVPVMWSRWKICVLSSTEDALLRAEVGVRRFFELLLLVGVEKFPPRRASERAGVQALEAAVCVWYRRSKTDPVFAEGKRKSRLRGVVALDVFLAGVAVVEGAPNMNAIGSAVGCPVPALLEAAEVFSAGESGNAGTEII